ncbi:MAG TPA: TonB-dependent receptor [Bryobacteraceae bacterium]|nr:TonB-dependent receptor [Bryobacteraceae bacterium]
MHQTHLGFVLLLGLALPPAGFAQSGESTQILGIVEDQSGAVVPAVAISATHVATGQVRRVVTGESGTYVFPFMAPGEYIVRAERDGFKADVRTGLILQLNQKARVDFQLQVGAVSEAVEVSARGVILNTDDATMGNVVEQRRVVDLPLNGRNFANLAGLMPGVIKGISSNTNQYGRRDTAIAISANGMRENQGQVLYDGVSTAWNINNATFFRASIEAIQEFKVHAGTYSAEYGHNAGAQVEILTRPGTNQVHGALFEFLRNDNFDARNYFRPRPLSKDVLQRNQFGFVLSGPVWIPKLYNGRDRTFWMVNYEGQREKQEVASVASVVPTAFRSSDFTSLATPLRDPLGGTFAGNVLPESRISPISRRYLEIHPQPNLPGTGANLAGVDQQLNNVNQVFARGDHNIGSNDKLFARVAVFNYNFPTIPINYFSTIDSRITARNAVLSHTHIFSPTVINEARLGFNRNWILRKNPRTNTNFDPESVGLQGIRAGAGAGQSRPLSPLETGYVPMAISGYLTMGDGDLLPDFNVSETWQIVDSITWTRGVHTFKAGIDFRRLRMDRAGANVPRGQFQFNGQVTGNAVADFLIGFPSQSQSPEGILPVEFRQHTYAWYVQDEWKATRKLTLNLGLRYDYVGTVDEINGIQRALRLDRPGGYLYPESSATEPREPARFYNAEKNRFWPRLGLAYRPADGWVIRMGGGVFNNANQMNNLTVFSDPERRASITFVADPQNPTALTFDNPFPIALEAAAPPINVVYIPPDRVNAYNVQWSASVQRQLSESTALELAYVGSQASHLDNSRNLNDALPGTGAFQPRRPFPRWGAIRYLASDGKSYYQSMQVRAERRFSRGLSFLAGYTWAHNIDQAYGTNESLPFTPGGVQNQNCFACERANSGFDYRHRFTTSFLWSVPTPASWRGALRFALANWSFNGILTYQTGFPFTVTQQGNRQGTGSATQRPDYVSGQSPKLSNPDPSRWFNTDAFQFAELKYGAVGRNTLRQPGMKVWDIGLFKEFPITEGHRFQFRWEAFNLWNTPQFRAPNAQLGGPSFGQITSTWLDNRQMQFALKYLF